MERTDAPWHMIFNIIGRLFSGNATGFIGHSYSCDIIQCDNRWQRWCGVAQRKAGTSIYPYPNANGISPIMNGYFPTLVYPHP
jgi:hypothetical protein